jgi:hypothetical protein
MEACRIFFWGKKRNFSQGVWTMQTQRELSPVPNVSACGYVSPNSLTAVAGQEK